MSPGDEAQKELESEEGGKQQRKCGCRRPEDTGSKTPEISDSPKSQNVQLLVWEMHVAWESANSGDWDGLKRTEERTGLLQHFSVEGGYRITLWASSLVGNYA